MNVVKTPREISSAVKAFEKELRSWLRDYNRLMSKQETVDVIGYDEGVYDFDQISDALSLVTKTMKRLDKVQKKIHRKLHK
jgi:hypothetical protein